MSDILSVQERRGGTSLIRAYDRYTVELPDFSSDKRGKKERLNLNYINFLYMYKNKKKKPQTSPSGRRATWGPIRKVRYPPLLLMSRVVVVGINLCRICFLLNFFFFLDKQ